MASSRYKHFLPKAVTVAFGKLSILFLLQAILFVHGIPARGQINGYPPLSAVRTTQKNIFSPDPLFNARWAHPEKINDLENYNLRPVSWFASKPAAFNMTKFSQNRLIVVNGEGCLRFDFGQTNAGWLEFDSPDFTGKVEMSISEYNRPPEYPANYPTKTLTPEKHGNTYRLELNPDLYEGVRYGWIHVRSFTKPWHITDIRLVCQIKPVNYVGSFFCSDSLLTRIWYTGAYTVKLNLLKNYLGAILMNRGDRFSWTGDAYPAQAASMVAFGNYDYIKMNIANTSTQSNGIRSYALYWVLSLIDYYNYTGDTLTLNKYLTNACAKLDDAFRVYGTNPNLEFYGWDERLGAGFEHPNIAEAQNAYKMLSIRAWNSFASAMKNFGRMDLEEKYNRYAVDKMSLLRKDSAWYRDFGLHAGADAATTGLLNRPEKEYLYVNHFTDRVNRISYSSFNEYFIIQALALMNHYDAAIGSIHDLWGGQIKYGATTFFEDYRPSWNDIIGQNGAVPNNQCGFTSLCHPWGAGVTKWLSEEVLGIKPTSPGFRTFDILPHLGRELSWVAGNTATPKGSIAASFNVATGRCEVSIPVGSVGRVGIPKVERNIKSVKVNGVIVWNGRYHSVAGIKDATEDARFIYLKDVLPGSYSITVDYNGTTPGYTESPIRYDAICDGIDTTTAGNWGRKFGKDGYVLCNYYGNGKDKDSLPAYINSVNYYKIKGDGKPLSHVWDTNTNDVRALAATPLNDFPRTAACLYAMDADQIGYTFTTTIEAKAKRNYKVSLYFVDWDKKGREIAVEMFDAATSNLIAPVKILKNSKGGAYITYSYNRSVKFRIDMVRGGNAPLSGIFFDPE